MQKPRVVYFIKHYPQISETYVKSEIDAISDEYDVLVITLGKAEVPYKNHAPYKVIYEWDEIAEAIKKYNPLVLHTHWLYNIWHLDYFSKKTNIPFTIRAHSFDVLIDPIKHYQTAVSITNNDLCLGIITFPFGRESLEKVGIRSDKLYDCYPVANYQRFYDRSPNGDAVMNVGACLPKKKMEDFLKLATLSANNKFNLYALAYDSEKFETLNKQMGTPVNIIPPVEPEDMPAEYKKHRWLVYTASHEICTVGWPIAIAEAQASGVGVCMANIRPDLKEYVGDAGYLFNSIDEALDIIKQPFPEDKRELGFEHAKKSDINEHKKILTRLWDNAYNI